MFKDKIEMIFKYFLSFIINMEEQPWLDTIPRNLPPCGRLCSFCRERTHNISTCYKAYQAGNILHNCVMNIINDTINNNTRSGVFQHIKEYLNLHTLKELKLIVRKFGDVESFARRLYDNNLFNITERCLYRKRGLVKILTLYYFNNVEFPGIIHGQAPSKKFHIKPNVFVDYECDSELPLFQCPICLEDKELPQKLTTNCNHDVCEKCFDLYLENLPRDKEPICSLCRCPTTEITFTTEECCNKIKNKYFHL